MRSIFTVEWPDGESLDTGEEVDRVYYSRKDAQDGIDGLGIPEQDERELRIVEYREVAEAALVSLALDGPQDTSAKEGAKGK